MARHASALGAIIEVLPIPTTVVSGTLSSIRGDWLPQITAGGELRVRTVWVMRRPPPCCHLTAINIFMLKGHGIRPREVPVWLMKL